MSENRTEYDAAFEAGRNIAMARAQIERLGDELPRFVGIPVDPNTSCPLVQIKDYEDHLPHPQRVKGMIRLATPKDLAEYAGMYRTNETNAYLDEETRTVTVVFNDHAVSEPESVANLKGDDSVRLVPGTAGWRDHRAIFGMKLDEDWCVWIGKDGKPMPQEEFLDFLEDHRLTIEEPDAATILEAVRDFREATVLTFQSAKNLQNGTTSFTWDDGGTRKETSMPSVLQLALRPIEGGAVQTVMAHLRYRKNAQGLILFYRLVRPDRVLKAAVEAQFQMAQTLLEDHRIPCFRGTP